VALVGDAAGYVDAVTGEGLALAFAEALALGPALAAGDLAAYARASARLRRIPEAITRLVLALSRRPAPRRRAIAALAADPAFFGRLLGTLGAGRPLGTLGGGARSADEALHPAAHDELRCRARRGLDRRPGAAVRWRSCSSRRDPRASTSRATTPPRSTPWPGRRRTVARLRGASARRRRCGSSSRATCSGPEGSPSSRASSGRRDPGRALAGSLAARGLAKLEIEPGLAPEALRAALLDDRLARALGWIAADGSAASVLLELEPPGGDARGARRLAAARRRTGLAIASGRPRRRRPLERALDRSADEIVTRFFPLLVLFALLLLAATFRDLGGVVVPLAFVFVCEALVIGAMGWAGVRLHLVLAILPPLLFVIALATAVHLAIRCRALEAEGEGAVEAMIATYREKGAAVLWISLSTACGFASLAASDVTPVAELGRWATLDSRSSSAHAHPALLR
jgi:hypothetical protein